MHIDLMILKTVDEQFALSTKKNHCMSPLIVSIDFHSGLTKYNSHLYTVTDTVTDLVNIEHMGNR